MYVMSSLPPKDQSIAGGIFNTINKLCNNLSLGISTSIYASVSGGLGNASVDNIKPYLSVYWYAAACAGLSLLFVPFLTLGTQGGHPGSDSGEDTGEDGDTAVEVGVVGEKEGVSGKVPQCERKEIRKETTVFPKGKETDLKNDVVSIISI